ncbi:MAG: endonuclease III [Acetoanaerobium sp.]|uniref:Endonuclease III n=1 Tax=Acetoanaerobium sticklandii (strain ATCC 12662 / DSM 519 / JCM 1433 / CCUG 9281 / NCIMB 10654 / HF) TaxID=499177 RepID=E3PXQ6_ACESD|nr:endonuclease III [Acetoanaerobium sticklandii]MBP8763235.1 endonuclease III [Acetoanaerobium sp.]MBP9499400.1 endonuclease III [Acetoanaerobium sp.]MBP9561791.1 endonuclease III [Acetoanaerobium sp.]CBH21221.1 DNA glycosylase and apyrimidinic (AP) lyase (endonuclease III) [Acetoanaerobium sticklandii]
MSKYNIIVKTLLDTYPDAKCELEYKTPYELLVATVLSAQSTDVRVNIVTKELFKNYNTPEKILKLGEEKLMEYIKSIGFYNVKSKNIIALSHLLIQNYDSQVPDEMDELLKLPGVGRKTANVVLSNCFGVPAIAVDTHVFRVSTRLGFSDKKDPLQVEQDLMKKISKKYWTDAHHAFIFHGRRICKARNPICELCSVQSYCKFYKKKKG